MIAESIYILTNMRPQLFLFLLLLTGCPSVPGSDEESHSNEVDSQTTEIHACNQDGTINDLSVTEQASDENLGTHTTDAVAGEVVAESATTGSTPDIPNGGLSPVVPNSGIGVLKRAILPLGQAEECAENHDCRILATDGVKASVEHCGNVTIVVVPK